MTPILGRSHAPNGRRWIRVVAAISVTVLVGLGCSDDASEEADGGTDTAVRDTASERDTGETGGMDVVDSASDTHGGELGDSGDTAGGSDSADRDSEDGGRDVGRDSGDTGSADSSAPDSSSGGVEPCCKSPSCTYKTPQRCRSQGGTPKPNTTCGDNPCSFTTGACCHPTFSCGNETKTECDNLAGDFNRGSSCADDPCPRTSLGACCVKGGDRCRYTTQSACNTFGGTYHANLDCAQHPC